MSDSVSSLLSGSLPMDTNPMAQNASQARINDATEDMQASDFSTLFSEINFSGIYPGTTLPITPLGAAVLPATADTEGQMGLPFASELTLADGNLLPGVLPYPADSASIDQDQPLVAISGFSAQSDPTGARAVSFQGDGKSMISSSPQYAQSLMPAIMQSQNQLGDITAIQEANPEAVALTERLAADKESANSLRLQQQVTAGLIDSMTQGNTANSPSLPGVQGASEFANVLMASRPNAEPMTALPNQPQWGDQVGDRINWLVSQGLRQAEIRLNPPELGKLEVRIQVSGDQANVQFTTAHAEVKDALDSAIPRLREMLAETGLNLGDVNVSQQGRQQTQDQAQGTLNAGSSAAEGDVLEQAVEEVIRPIKNNGIIDFYA